MKKIQSWNLYLFYSLLHDLHQMLGVTHVAGLVLGLLEVWRCQRAARLWGRRELEGVARPAVWLGRGWQESPRLVAVQTRLGPVRRTRRVNETLGRTEGKLSLFFKFPKNSSSKRQCLRVRPNYMNCSDKFLETGKACLVAHSST